MALTFDAAMRVSEAVGALWPGVDWVKSRIRFARRKTGDEHEVTLTMSLPHLEAYRRSLGVVRPAGLIFPGRAGGLRPLTTRAAQLVMVRLCEWAGIPRGKARMHALRHGRATALLEAGCPLEAVRQHLGHSSAELTSSTYAHVADGWVAEQIRSASR